MIYKARQIGDVPPRCKIAEILPTSKEIHLLVYDYIRVPVILTHAVERLAVEMSLPVLTTYLSPHKSASTTQFKVSPNPKKLRYK